MCGRFVAATPPDQLASYFGAEQLGEAQEIEESLFEPRYNVAPTDKAPVIVRRHSASGDDVRMLDAFRWGLIPFWAKDAKIGSKMINARAETVATKNAFRRSLAQRRCIIAADSFYEWTLLAGQAKKTAMRIHRVDDAPFAFAGLWDTWVDPDDEDGRRVRSCTIITTSANDKIAQIHDRMPVMLPPSTWDQWLDPSEVDVDAVTPLLVPAPSELLVMHPVSSAVNNSRSEGQALMDPIEVVGAPS